MLRPHTKDEEAAVITAAIGYAINRVVIASKDAMREARLRLESNDADNTSTKGVYYAFAMLIHDVLEPEVTTEGITEMRLCEAGRVALKPDVHYHFTVDPDCDVCKRMARYATANPAAHLAATDDDPER